jgi:hypothetical protein
MSYRKTREITWKLAAVSSVLFFAAYAAVAQTQSTRRAEERTATQLTEIARDAIEAENDVLVNGDVNRSLSRRPLASLHRNGIAQRLENSLRRNKALTAQKIGYKSHKTQVTVNDVKIEGDKAVMTATEYVILALEPVPDGPDQTEYVQDHVMEFVKEGNQWRLVSDSVPPPPPLPEPATVPIFVPPLEEAPPNFIPEARQQAIRSGNNSPWLKASYVASSAPMYGSYNGTAAAVYAYAYWGPSNSNYNTLQYRTYGNDCTNFTSQTLKYAGWPYDSNGSRTANDTWYYGTFSSTTSYSWAGANNFLLFFYYYSGGRGYIARYFSELSRGDILQADWGPSPDGTINHSMVVTKKDSYGRLYLTYHTNNTKDKPLADIQAANPGTNYYGEKMYSSF